MTRVVAAVADYTCIVLLTLSARDEGRGRAAVADLEKEGLKPLYHQLDLNDASSREKLGEFVKENYGGLDLLVNNAAIAYKVHSTPR